MSQVAISGNASGTGTLTIAAPNTNSNYTLTLPQATTTIVGTDATQTLTNKTIQGGVITSGTMVATTSGTSVNYTDIPSWVKRITVMFDSVSTNGTSNYLIQLGDSGGIETTGYVSSSAYLNTSADMVVSTAGFILNAVSASSSYSGTIVLTLMDSATNKWTAFGGIGWYPSLPVVLTTGAKSLSATLDRIRITTVIGTNTFDAGSINILYE